MDNMRQLPGQSNANELVRPAEVVYRDPDSLSHVAAPGSESGLVDYWRIIRRHKGTVLLVIVLGALLGFLTTLPQTPIYRAHTTLAVQGINENFLNMKDFSRTGTAAMDP